MFTRFCGFGLLAALVMALAGGCGRSTPENNKPEAVKTQTTPQKPVAAEPAARVHWLGMKKLLAETNAATFKTLWDLPETTRLLSQTLDKLALAPWRQSIPALLGAATNYPSLITNYPSLVKNHPFATLLRPLLDDAVQEECYFELQPRTNQPGDLVLAIRLDDQRSAAWQTNLLAVAENLCATKATFDSQGNGWSIPFTPPPPGSDRVSSPSTNLPAGSTSASSPPTLSSGGGEGDRSQAPGASKQESSVRRMLSLSHSGAWTLLSLTTEQSTLGADLARRIQSGPGDNPVEQGTTNYWLEAHLDMQRLWPTFAEKNNLPTDLPQASLTWIGDGKDVQTRGTFTFSKPLPFTIEPWNIPTNLLHEPLDSSTGLQGVKPWLQSLKIWKDLDLGEPPNQIFWWAREGIPFFSYCAAPMPNVNEFLEKARVHLLHGGNQWLATNGTGFFENATNRNALLWRVVPFMAPIIEALQATNNPCLLLGLAPNDSTNASPPAETLGNVISRTNAFYYDWERTGSRIEEWIYIGQLSRLMFNRPQVPHKSPSLAWLKALEPKLGDSRTVLARTAPCEVSLKRSSSLGFTAIELHLLVDWLESPEFPFGVHTMRAEAQKRNMPVTPHPGTNSSATLKK